MDCRGLVGGWPWHSCFCFKPGQPLASTGALPCPCPASGCPRPQIPGEGSLGCWLCTQAVCGNEASTVAGCRTCHVNRCRQHLLCSAGTVGSFAAGLLLGLWGLHLTGSDSVNSCHFAAILRRALGPVTSWPGPGLTQR